MVLGLDISTSKIGYSILPENLDEYVYKKIGFIEPEGDNIFEKTYYAVNKVKELVDKYNINWCFTENNLLSFAAGRSSANVIVMLVTINSIITYKLKKEWNIKTKRIHPSHARKVAIGKSRSKKFKSAKRMACYWLINKYGRKLRDELPTLKTKMKFEGSGAFDIVDSMIVGISGIKEFIFDKEI